MFPSLAQLVWLSLLQGGLFLQAFRGPLANQHFTDNITCLEHYIAALLINLFEVVTKIIIFDRWQNWPLATEHMLFFSGIRWMHAHKELQMQCEPWFQVYQKVCLVHWNLPFAAACYVLGHVNMFWLVMYCCIDMVCWHGHNFWHNIIKQCLWN